MSKVDCVVVMLELHSEGESIVVTSCLTFHTVLIVTNVVSSPDPTLSVSLCLNLTIHQRSHPVIIETIWLEQVDNVESISAPSTCV